VTIPKISIPATTVLSEIFATLLNLNLCKISTNNIAAAIQNAGNRGIKWWIRTHPVKIKRGIAHKRIK
jgi:hypothetical protein